MGLTAEPFSAPVGTDSKGLLPRAVGLAGVLVAVVFVMVAAVVVVIAVATHLSGSRQYTAAGHPILVVLSGSMSPTIKTGDLIVDDRVPAAQASHLRVGQIATFFEAPGSTATITHRIVKVVRRNGQVSYVTKGDRNDAPDSPSRPASLVVGTYAWKIPRGGTFLYNLHKPIVLGLLLAAPILWFVAEPLRRWAREEDEPKDPSDADGAPEGETP